MNIRMRLAGIAVISVVLHQAADAASVCQDRRVAITIGEVSQQAAHLQARGDRANAATHKQMADQLAKAHCIRVDTYPPARSYTKIKLGCQVFSGEARLSNGQITTVHWTLCP
jgi:hypothetical protein